MAVRTYKAREQFALEHPLVIEKSDDFVTGEPTSCQWLFEHAVYDKRRRHYVIAYRSECPLKPDPCILTVEVKMFRGKFNISVYQRFELSTPESF